MTNYGFLVRYDAFDPNTENDKDKGVGYQDEQSLLLIGYWYRPIKGVQFCINYRTIGYTAEIPDDKGEMVTMQPDQFVFVNSEVKF
jgi:hypothetical protein